MDYQRCEHEFPPIFQMDSKILILGSFPSVKSREIQFYYGHPRNRFWKLLADLKQEPVPETIEEKKAFLLRSQIALWDVIASCEIKGSSDSSIRNVIPNDIASILKKSQIRKIYANGGKAKQLYDRYLAETTKIPAILLPSTSPANAAYRMEDLMEAWKVILS